jgi:CubicO group peptidase (beta-lactamase class C family)
MLSALFAWLLAVSPAIVQSGQLSNEKQGKIKNAVSTFMAANKIPGISAAVVRDGKFAWSAGFGMADQLVSKVWLKSAIAYPPCAPIWWRLDYN